MGADVIERGLHLDLAERLLGAADPFAAEAEAAIDRAMQKRRQQQPVGIAVDDALDRRIGVVADRIGPLDPGGLQFAQVGNELARDRILGIGAVDQFRQQRRHRHGVLVGNQLHRAGFCKPGSGEVFT